MSARAAVTTVFFLNGAVFSSWYARLPAIQGDIGLGPGALGARSLRFAVRRVAEAARHSAVDSGGALGEGSPPAGLCVR
jgi:hypothetical protein